MYIYIYREGPSDFLIYHFDVISLAVSSLEGKSLDLLLGGGGYWKSWFEPSNFF